MPKILIGVTGSIAAYKAASIVSILVDKGHDVKVIMTNNAKKFICPITFSALSHNSVYDDNCEFSIDGHIHHIELAEWAEIFVIVPATFNTITKIINLTADNLLTSTIIPYLGMNKKFMAFPAMNTNMHTYFNRPDNYQKPHPWLMNTTNGRMACGSIGDGKLLPTDEIIKQIGEAFIQSGTNYA